MILDLELAAEFMGCQPQPPFWGACNRVCEAGQVECPHHLARRAGLEERERARSAAREKERHAKQWLKKHNAQKEKKRA